MNCNEFDKITLMLARHKLTDAAIREPALSHAEGCARCSERLEEEKELSAGVKAVVVEIAQRAAPRHVEAALLAAFRERVAAANSPAVVTMPTRSWHSTYWRIEAIAAMILISASAVFWQHFRSSNQKHDANWSSVSIPNTNGDETARSASPEQAIDPVPDKTEQPPNRRTRRQHSESVSNETEVVTEFFALTEDEHLDSLDSLQVMRVELPGSALASVGLPVDASTASEPVIADVVLGPDGLARAIRFVR